MCVCVWKYNLYSSSPYSISQPSQPTQNGDHFNFVHKFKTFCLQNTFNQPSTEQGAHFEVYKNLLKYSQMFGNVFLQTGKLVPSFLSHKRSGEKKKRRYYIPVQLIYKYILSLHLLLPSTVWNCSGKLWRNVPEINNTHQSAPINIFIEQQ